MGAAEKSGAVRSLLRGVSTATQEALSASGKDAPNHAGGDSRLTAEWQTDYDVGRSATSRRGDTCMCGRTGSTCRPDGRSRPMYAGADWRNTRGQEELVGSRPECERAHRAGVSFSSTSSSVGSRCARPRGRRRRARFGGDRAGSEHQTPAVWVHKTANVLNKVALSVQINMKIDLREITARRPAPRPRQRSVCSPTNTMPSTTRRRVDQGPGSALAFLTPRRALGPSRTSNPIESARRCVIEPRTKGALSAKTPS